MWKTIDTAPKDGRPILGWCEPYGWQVLNFLHGDWLAIGHDDMFKQFPIYWQELPEPPNVP